MTLLELRAKAGYEECMRSYAHMAPLPPELEAKCYETPWVDLDDPLKQHWMNIAAAVFEVRVEA